MKARIILVSLLVILLFALLGTVTWMVWANFFPTPLRLKTAKVERADLAKSVETSGELIPSVQVGVVSELSGKIVEVYVASGQQVEAGQLIARLDSTQLELELREAQARVDSEQANKDKIERVLRGEIPAPPTTAGEAKQYSVEDLKIAQAQLEQAKAALKMTQGKVEAAQVKAPVFGTITELNAVAGQVIPANTTLATLFDPTKIFFQASVDETDISHIKQGQEAEIMLDAYPDKVLRGKVAEVGQTPSANKAGGTFYPIKIKLTISKNAELRSGLKGDAKIVVEMRFRTLVVPAQAVTGKGEQQAVFTVEKSHLKKKRVKAGLVTEETYEIVEGLREGEKVVLEQVDRLKGGEKVKER